MSNTYTSLVNPMIGTDEHGHTTPSATVPFGLVQLGPDTDIRPAEGIEKWDWCSGYHYSDRSIMGFSHTHLSGTGDGDLCDILIMPTTGQVQLEPGPRNFPERGYRSRFSHDQEYASPGYYKVFLKDYGIHAELTASVRAGFSKIIYPEVTEGNLIIDLSHANREIILDSYLKVIDNNLIVGYRFSRGMAKFQRLYFAARFSRSFKSAKLARKTEFIEAKEDQGLNIKSFLQFDLSESRELLVKVGISSVSIEGALNNLDAEINHWSFDKTKKEAEDAWEKELQKINIESSNRQMKEIFYTSMYHLMLGPVIFNDVDGRYSDHLGNVHQVTDRNYYSTFSIWDTFRGVHPLYTILQQGKSAEFTNTIMQHYKEHGKLPVWTLWANETNAMVGYHAAAILTDAYLKGVYDFDPEVAFKAMKEAANEFHLHKNMYRERGYIPYTSSYKSVAITQEYAYDDWCIAQMAKTLGKQTDHEYFLQRASNYKNIFDSKTGFMRGRDIHGNFREPFEPRYSNHGSDDYIEGTAWQWSWWAPHDVEGLIGLHGGKEKFARKLDQLFNENPSMVFGERPSNDITGMLGQYAHGNEPSLHIAYLYNYAGKPWKTQEMVSRIAHQLYDNTPGGVCGNEDYGTISAWFIFSALGFYSVNPVGGNYVIGTPLFDRMEISLENNKTFTVLAPGVSPQNCFIQSVKLNNKDYHQNYINHHDIIKGGILEFEMSDVPNQNWGNKEVDLPPSMSDLKSEAI